MKRLLPLVFCIPQCAQVSILNLGSTKEMPIGIIMDDVGKGTVSFEMAAREDLNP